jgi:subtilisin family serine protease
MLLAFLVGVGLPGHSLQAREARGRYVVVLKDSARPLREVVGRQTGRLGTEPTHVYRAALRGYAASMTADQASRLAANPRVAFVERDRRFSAFGFTPWGLDRIDQASPPLDFTFNYVADGSGVRAYVIDTGVALGHSEFGGRAVSGKDFVQPGTPAEDCHGHGTHVAGTLGGATYGVAKGVGIVAVRVLDCTGWGYLSDLVGAVNWVTKQHHPGQPAVANMSLGGPPMRSLALAVRNSIADGVAFTAAAGNEGQNACNATPAKIPAVITVSATNKQDVRPWWANYGSCVDLFAPGKAITSAWKSGPPRTIDGTSMASPHVAGVVAQYLQTDPTATPAKVRAELDSTLTTDGIVSSAKSLRNDLLFTNL